MFLSIRRATTLSLAILLGTNAHLIAGIIAGPMLSHVEMREATVWLQTDTPTKVRVAYTEEGNKNALKWSNAIQTNNDYGHTANITLDAIEPGTHYNYRIELDGKLQKALNTFATPANFQGRTPPPDLRIALGGAHYVPEDGFEPPYQTLGGGYGIFSTILDAAPDLMIWAGNTAHLRDSDWSTRSGTLKRFSKARSVAELQPLLASLPHYATWSNSDYSTSHAGHHYSFRQNVEKCFNAFWPRPVKIKPLEGIATRFRRSDVDFFMLDVRSYRDDIPTSNRPPQILGHKQIEWLRQEILRSTATFKIIIAGAPILNPADNRNNLSYANREQTKLLQMLRNEHISGVFFISGGKDYGELTKLEHAGGYNLYDLTLGPLTANPLQNPNELNFFRIPGSGTYERHFALIDFTGTESDRQLTIRVMGMDGKELWQRTIKASQLQHSH
jgi:alkaline phosphatase D